MIQQRFNLCAPIERPDYAQIPVATQAIVAVLLKCDYVGNTNDLTTGLQPFLTTYTSQDNNAHLRELNAMAADLQSGDTGMNLQDVLQLRQAAKLPLPATMWHALVTAKAFIILLAEALGYALAHQPLPQLPSSPTKL